MSEMKNCPFCGNDGVRVEAAIALSGDHYESEYRGMCLYCSARGPDELTKVQAVETWNMRREVHLSVQVDAGAYEDLRNATPEELLEAVVWFYRRESTISLAEAEEKISLLRHGFALAQPGGWERVAPMWLRESREAKEK